MKILFEKFQKYNNILARISSKKDGPMKLAANNNTNRKILLNRKEFIDSLPMAPVAIVSANLVHGSTIKVIKKNDKRSFIDNSDGLITNEKGILLTITVADCLPIFIYCPDKQVIGLIHAGWRGLDKHIIKNAMNIFKNYYNCDSSKVVVGIGPSIHKCHFEVKNDVVKQFNEYLEVVYKNKEKTFLDLQMIATRQLLQEGVKEENIEVNTSCTYEGSEYFSSRQDSTQPLKTNMAVLGLQE